MLHRLFTPGTGSGATPTVRLPTFTHAPFSLSPSAAHNSGHPAPTSEPTNETKSQPSSRTPSNVAPANNDGLPSNPTQPDSADPSHGQPASTQK